MRFEIQSLLARWREVSVVLAETEELSDRLAEHRAEMSSGLHLVRDLSRVRIGAAAHAQDLRRAFGRPDPVRTPPSEF